MRISAKDLGWLEEPSFCPRCFWIERHANGLPYQGGFPGIFSSIDTYTKHIVEKYFERNGKLPKWLKEIGEIKRIVNIKPSEFKVERGDMLLTGIPDLLFQRPDNSFGIVDYKTAKYTGMQDSFMPIYQIQLNGYAYISEALGDKPVKDLYLIYFEPPYKERFDELSSKHTKDDGFEMPFKPKIHKIKKDVKEVERLLEKASKIYSSEKMPESADGCKDCVRLDGLIKLVDKN
ncbi:MAG: PD-(D/E)XK nuclease family protein [Candidatus Micrarchaeaceae archaeon]